MKMNPVIFREYDIRGVVHHDFDEEFAYLLGCAVASAIIDQFGAPATMTIGHDARLSSPGLAAAVARGAMSTGMEVLHLGLVTTPLSYYSTFALSQVKGSIMVTGSHNPPEYNGFKISVGKSTIFGADILDLKHRMENKRFHSGQGKESKIDIFPSYLERYHREFGKMRPFPLVLDCGNGTAGCVARTLFEGVGLKPVILFEEPDGTFPNHHPDPTVAENLQDLIAEVKRTQSAIGIGFDGDSDRIGLVDDRGEIILGDELIALCSRFILNEKPGQKIIGDVKCSDRMYDDIARHGGVPIMWKTGHSLVKEKIRVEGAPFGGELSGHIFFADRNYGYDDALYAALRVCEIIAKTGKTISELLGDLPKSYNTPEIRIDTTEEKKHAIVDTLKKVYGSPSTSFKANFLDGVRVSFQDGWALARASNTQPVLVLRFESNSQAGLDRIRGEFERVVEPLL